MIKSPSVEKKQLKNIEFTRFTDDRIISKKTGLTSDEIWDAGVCLDDWDYGYIGKGIVTTKIETDLRLDSWLNGVCDNKWYLIQDKKGNYWTICMAYHA